jgi:putative FmdB family regulatory protein
MPFYEYTSINDNDCAYCRDRFTVLQRISDETLTVCAICGGPVKRVISPPHVVSGQAHKLKESNIEKSGFTQYKKIGKGVYEKTAGKGPGVISAD